MLWGLVQDVAAQETRRRSWEGCRACDFIDQLVDPLPPVNPQASLPAPSPDRRQTRCGLLKGPVVAQRSRKSQALRRRLQRVQLPRGLEAAKEGQAGREAGRARRKRKQGE
ncbi:hypothetical protein L198_06990 [Cryptococcus wingfieldii CBS 7118]|uniref:Uncharacterized protein n=1 Tax=Cryptococcus wingfieldii CBS 7118 TaxID=1295528 RepID=A0A1E3IHF5_9TREE|nr:hypothetical protein L198_06990 [Cryptococcus wingfieldii CBS 7118]ODN87366.1 hypothetical protein L198_06990 [Cryptococcus wingfieldii CBS 7118]